MANFKKIYDNQEGAWHEVTEEQFKEINQYCNTIRKREQRRHRCCCPRERFWYCNGICTDCKYYISQNELSLDEERQQDGEGIITLHDIIAFDDPPLDESVAEYDLLGQLMERVYELMPEARDIGELRLQGLSDEAIADQIHIKRKTFTYRIEKVRKQLIEEFGDDLPEYIRKKF